MSEPSILIDAQNIAPDLIRMSGDSTHIFDQMTSNGARLALTDEILDEMTDSPGKGTQEFLNWMKLDKSIDSLESENLDSTKVKILEIEDLTVEDYRNYQNHLDDASGAFPGSDTRQGDGKIAKELRKYDADIESGIDPDVAFEKLTEKGDVSMAKALDESSEAMNVLSNDKSFAGTVKNSGYDGPGEFKVYRGAYELLNDMIDDDRIDAEQYKTYTSRIDDLNLTVPNSGRNALLSDADLEARTSPLSGVNANEAEAIRGIGDAAAKGRLMGFTTDPEGQTVYVLEKDNGVLHRFNNVDGELSYAESTNFPDTKSAGQHVSELLREAGQTYPESFKGMPNVNHSLSGLEDELEHMRRPGWMKGAAGALDEGSRFLGKASKVLGPLGVFATGAEAAELELKLQDYEEIGLVPPEAMLAYRGILTGHVGQATIDPSMVGGELAVQGAYDKWVESYNIDPQTAEALEPGSLIEDLIAADKWLQAQATVAGVKTREYVSSRWEEPELIAGDMREAGEAYIDMHREAAQTIGDYAKDSWNNPEKFTEDVQGLNEQIMKLTPPGQAIHYGRKLWDSTLGREAASRGAMEDLGLNADNTDNTDNTDNSSADVNRETTEITIDEARMIIDHDRPIILEDLQARAAREGLSKDEADYAEALDAPVVPALLDTLEKGGIQTLDITGKSMDTPQNRVDAVVDSGAKAYEGNNLPTPQAEFNAAYDNQYGHNNHNNQDNDYEKDDSYGYDLMS